jgi:glutamate synthase (NADPH/NADH) large chain
MTRYDNERMRQLIEKHLHYTGSARAREILDNWEDYLPKFVKVMPVEYRRALEEMTKHQEADTTGLDELEIGLRGGA